MEELGGPAEKFSFKGALALPKFYEFSINLLQDMGYKVKETEIAKKQNVEGFMTDVRYTWECKKTIDNYSQSFLKVGIEVSDLAPDGTGKIKVSLSSALRLDYQEAWDASSFLRSVRKYYQKNIYKSVLGTNKTKVANDMMGVRSEFKSFFQLQSYL